MSFVSGYVSYTPAKAIAQAEGQQRFGVSRRIAKGPELKLAPELRIRLDLIHHRQPHLRNGHESVHEDDRDFVGIVRLDEVKSFDVLITRRVNEGSVFNQHGSG